MCETAVNARCGDPGFEDVDRTPSAAGCAAYLELAGELPEARAYKERSFSLVAPDPGLAILEVGCGTGADLLALARQLGSHGCVVGIDRSFAMARASVCAAAGAADAARIALGQADIHALPFGSASFAGCRADRVLQHVEHPRRAVAELARVVRPGGRLVVSEPDWDSLVIDLGSDVGSPGQTRSLARRLRDALADGVRHGAIGSRLPRLFAEAGLVSVRVEAHALTLSTPRLAEEILGLSTRAVAAFERGALEAEETARVLALLDTAGHTGRLFCSLTGFTVVAEPPL